MQEEMQTDTLLLQMQTMVLSQQLLVGQELVQQQQKLLHTI